jgi:hypothetical protein
MKQIITVTSINPISPNSQTTLDVIYETAAPQNETLTGLGLRLHYDSSEIDIYVEDIFSAGLSANQDQADTLISRSHRLGQFLKTEYVLPKQGGYPPLLGSRTVRDSFPSHLLRYNR